MGDVFSHVMVSWYKGIQGFTGVSKGLQGRAAIFSGHYT